MKQLNKNMILKGVIVFLVLILGIFSLYKENNSNKDNGNDINQNYNNDTNASIDVTNKKSEQEKIITVYLFRGEGCPHCEDALEHFEDLLNKYSYLDLKVFEVWYNDENNALFEKITDYFNVERKAVPFIVIGDNYKLGYAHGSDLSKEIELAYNDTEYKEIVQEIINNNQDINPVYDNQNN